MGQEPALEGQNHKVVPPSTPDF